MKESIFILIILIAFLAVWDLLLYMMYIMI